MKYKNTFITKEYYNMKTIYKYNLKRLSMISEGFLQIQVPKGAKVLSIQKQYGKPVVYMLVDTHEYECETETIVFVPCVTGERIGDSIENYTYLGTMLYADDTYVEHYFYRFIDRVQ